MAFFTLCIFNHLGAQNFPFREYGVQDGLPQSQSTSLTQDSRGFLWILTRNGLSRFDGTEFVNYFRRDGLPANYMSNVFEDNKGKIWTLSSEGLSVYTGTGFKFYKQDTASERKIFGFEFVVDNNNDFYVLTTSTETRIARITKFTNGIYSDYSGLNPALDTLQIKNIAFDNLNDELLIFDLKSQLWAWKNGHLAKLSSEKFDYLTEVNDQIMLVSGEKTYHYENRKLKPFKAGNINGKAEVVYKDPTFVDFFDGKSTSRIRIPFANAVVDKEGNLWFTSESNIKRLLSTAFLYYPGDEFNIKNTWAIAEDKNGHMWFGSLFNNLVEFDGVSFRERNEFKSLFKEPVSFYKGSRRMTDGNEWFSTSEGVLIWDGRTFSRLKSIPEHTQICYIYEDPENRIVMLGTDKGLFLIDNKNVATLFPEYIDSNLGVIEGVTRDDNGLYWLSGHNGVVRFDGKNSVPVKEQLLPLCFTYTIEKDSYGGIWVTSDEGLFMRKKGAEDFLPGLPDEINVSANSISIMDSTHILIGRISDICIIDLRKYYLNEKDYFRVYDKTDGFLGDDCIDNGIVKDRLGRYWILTSGKTVVFDPSKLKPNTKPPRLHITGIYYQTDSLLWKEVEGFQFFYNIPEQLVLTRFENKLQITFTGISTTNPEKVKMQYRLSGFNEEWSDPSGKKSVIYEKIPPGHYVFQLKALNADGVETPEPISIKLRILPAFWQTTFFMIFAALLILSSAVLLPIFLLKKWQVKKNEREKLKSELSHLQMSSVLRQFDPHFTFNVISSVGSLIMRGEKEVAYDYITKLSGLLRTVLSDGSLIIKPLSVELDFVRKYCDLQKLRFKGRFNYSINIHRNIDLEREIPKMTIQTFVENSIKHGFENRKEGGRVDIEVIRDEEQMEIRVVDNGVGRMAASEMKTGGTGNGLKIISGLFQVMNENNLTKSKVEIKDLEDKNGPSGTEVIITIPDNYRFEFIIR